MTTNWRDPAKYPDPKDRQARRWAWEFLRRDPDYGRPGSDTPRGAVSAGVARLFGETRAPRFIDVIPYSAGGGCPFLRSLIRHRPHGRSELRTSRAGDPYGGRPTGSLAYGEVS